MAKRKQEVKASDVETVKIVGGVCVQCAQPMVVNGPERWANEPDNSDAAWWNRMDFYCPHCHSFQNAGDEEKDRYTRPSGRAMSTGRSVVTLIIQPDNMFTPEGIVKESATSQPMSD